MISVLGMLRAVERALEEGQTPAEIKASLGVNRFELSHYRRLSRTLETPTRLVIERAGLSFAHARAIARLRGRDQEEFARDIAQRKWSAHRAEREVKAKLEGQTGGPSSDDYARLAETIGEQIGHPVEILVDRSDQRRGQINITFLDLDCFDSILGRLQVELNG